MQTFAEKMLHELEQNGLFPDQAKEVLQLIMDSEETEQMRNRWGDEVSGYPEGFFNIIFATSKTIVLDWIDKKCPMAWFRPMFLPVAERDALLKQFKNKEQ